ncbi:MAG TPA: C1 family peptidase, partial [Tenuifilaceae bacterium]|nr:C1 family peptidase [Tenuifilaceae bacterium]
MKKSTFLTVILSLFLAFTVFAQKGFVNPAAKYCEKLGYRYEIVNSKAGGDVGMVHLPDGRIVNEWDFFKGKVGQEFSYPARYGYDVTTETVEENGFQVERAVCIVPVKGIEERIPLIEFMEMNGDPLMEETNRSLSEFHSDANVDPNFVTSKSLPASFDWRSYNGHAYIGSPRNQGSCGSCYSFGAAAAAEGTYNFATGSYDSNTADFAEAYIAWCLSTMSAYSSHFGGCDGADYDYQELQALCDVGIINESYFPYVDADNQSCPSAASSAPKTKFESWHRVACNDIDAIKTAIMTYGVVDAAVYVSTAFQNYSGGIFTDSYTTCSSSPCYNTPTNHAISLVGWGYDATYGDYWILRNSWGSSWGEGGYMRIKATSARVGCSVCYMVYQDDGTTAPVLTTNSVTSIGDNSAVCGGNITSNGGATVTASGLVYAKTSAPTLTSGTVVSTSPVTTSGSYSLTMSGLNSGTTYYVRAYATNSKGTSYGTERTFTTTGETPIEYCTSQGNNFSYEWIAGVTVGSLTNTSGAAGYTD